MSIPIRSALLAAAGLGAAAQAASLQDVQHVVVIYQENWSFDGLLGKFPGADNLDSASADSKTQVDSGGTPYGLLPFNDAAHFKADLSLANGPWDLTKYLDADSLTEDLVHRYYQEQYQINGGRNNRFVAGSDAKALSMSYVDCTRLPLGVLGSEGVVMDHFFHSAFGGSFLNHIWMIAARTPRWPAGKALPASKLTRLDASGERLAGSDGFLRPDSFAINTVQPATWPYYPGTADSLRLPPLDFPTIGDRLDEAKVSWAWYSGGWDSALAGRGNAPDVNFQYHHQAFNYFRKFADTASNYRKAHLKDEKRFFEDLACGRLPAVSWIKPEGEQNEHPGYALLVDGQKHVKAIVDSLKARKDIWKHTVVIITYDEHGGRWDHVAPPKMDKWGPGLRVPGVLVSPLAKKGFVDKRTYETVSILSFLEHRWNLKPLTSRDAQADPFTGAFPFPIVGKGRPKGRDPHHAKPISLREVRGRLRVGFDTGEEGAVRIEVVTPGGICRARADLSGLGAGDHEAVLDPGRFGDRLLFVHVKGADGERTRMAWMR